MRILLLLCVIMSGTQVSADTTCPVVEVIQTGAYGGTGQGAIMLKNLEAGMPSWNQGEIRWFNLDWDGGSDAMLATALTALVSDKNIQVCAKDSGVFTPWSQLDQLYIIK